MASSPHFLAPLASGHVGTRKCNLPARTFAATIEMS